MRNVEKYTLHLDEGLPVVRGGATGTGRALCRGTALAEGTDNENAVFIRKMLKVRKKIWISGKAH